MILVPTTITNTAGRRGKAVSMTTITQSFKSFDGSTIHVLSDGRAVRDGVTGLMLLTGVGGEFVRYVASLDEVTA